MLIKPEIRGGITVNIRKNRTAHNALRLYQYFPEKNNEKRQCLIDIFSLTIR